MDRVPIANLEAELGHLDEESPHVTPKRDDGDTYDLFTAPNGSTFSLDPPSQTRSVYSFGSNGTLAWTTPAGELLQVASCVHNRLRGADYKRSIERGYDYEDRAKMLERALDSSHGRGYGIGLSLGEGVEPVERCWIDHRWPRFAFQYDGLEITLQYFVDSQSVIQEYHIRNPGQEEVKLPYIISSDICFREHWGQPRQFHPVPIGKSAERLLLFQNTEVLIRNEIGKFQLKMALFLNSKKQSLWTKPEPDKDTDQESVSGSSISSNALLNEVEERLRSKILGGQLVEEDADINLIRLNRYDRFHAERQRASHDMANLAAHQHNLIVPAGSTQKLCTVIQLSGLQLADLEPLEPQPALCEPARKIDDDVGQQKAETREKIRARHKALIINSRQMDTQNPDKEGKRRISEIHKDFIDLGVACAAIDEVVSARYYLFSACLVAQYFYREGSYALSDTRFTYAKHLHNHGWHSEALKILEDLSDTLSKGRSTTKDSKVLREKVQIRLANMYLETHRFAEAERIYRSALPDSITEGTALTPLSARCLERIAWAQVKQEKYEEASKTYSQLLSRRPEIRRQTILINIGFIERKLGRFEEAKKIFVQALETNEAGHAIDQCYARSGLYACLCKLGITPEEHPKIGSSIVKCPDVVSLLLRSRSAQLLIPPQGFPLGFILSRHLEYLLSSCSVPVQDGDEPPGIAFVDADPIDCYSEGRFAYFQFKFLTQIQKYIDNTEQEEGYRQKQKERIKATCRGHLVWCFKTAQCDDTWGTWYSVRGNVLDEKFPVGEPSLSNAVEGAYHFSKLWLYLNTWDTEWDFILDLLGSRLDEWLTYLDRTRYMDNLWVERYGYEELRPYNTIPPDSEHTYRSFPEYHLSDFTFLWLVFRQLEHLIDLIGNTHNLGATEEKSSVKQKFSRVRKAYADSQKTMGSQEIRSNIFRTFVIRPQAESGTKSNSDEKATKIVETDGYKQATVSTDMSSTSPIIEGSSFRGLQNSGTARKILVFRRTIKEYGFYIQPTDIATIEAAIAGFFEGPDEQYRSAWQENLKIQQDQHTPSLESPLQVALTLFAAKFGCNLGNPPVNGIETVCLSRLSLALYDSGVFAQTIVGNAPESMRSWSAPTYETLSNLVGGLFPDQYRKNGGPLQDAEVANTVQKRQPSYLERIGLIEISQQLSTSSNSASKYIVDTNTLPDWMYLNPYLHEKPLAIDMETDFEGVGGSDGFRTALDRWRSSKAFSHGLEDVVFVPHVADSGTKKSLGSAGDSVRRRMDIDWHYAAADFYDCLVRPRRFEDAKKRLVEFTSHKHEAALICWLVAPEQEKPLFQEFLRRHGSSENFFGERIDERGNIWETELHFGFYQLLSKKTNERFPPPHRDYHSQLRVREIPGLSQAPQIDEITPTSLSLRIVGDLRDRSWTCHFISSVARYRGFTSLIDEYNDSLMDEDTFYAEKIGQRKVLELTYVERFLIEMVQSCDDILDRFKTELEIPETRDLQSESYEFIDNHSRLNSKAGNILGELFKQLQLTVTTMELWEKREDSKREDHRDLRSRWSKKDESRHGKRLRDLGRKCRDGIRLLRSRMDSLGERRELARHSHNDLINYMALQNARTSSQSAEDVRLFTYVTIIFLPLSFSSSLFSMQGAPPGGVISVMAPTTVIALAVTIFVLANMKSLDRNLKTLVYKFNAKAERRMQQSEHPLGFRWTQISRDPEKSAQLQLKPENDKRLPAQSKWWYFLFWMSDVLKFPRLYVLKSFRTLGDLENTRINFAAFLVRIILTVLLIPVCIVIFAAQLFIVTTIDINELLWKAMRRLMNTMFQPPVSEKSPKKDSKEMLNKSGLDQGAKAEGIAGNEEQDEHVSRTKLSEDSSDATMEPGKFDRTFNKISNGLQDPPRPIKHFTAKKLDSSKNASDKSKPQKVDSDTEDGPLIDEDKMPSDDVWEIEIEKEFGGEEEDLLKSRSPSRILELRQPSPEFYQEPSSVWGSWNRRFKGWHKSESNV
ncbi:MAG: hypothetical protein Q9172_003465 [Xanthocarpia lactea]